MTPEASSFLSHCVSVDLEVDPKSARLFAFAAVRGEQALVHKGAALEPALDRLESLCDGAAHLVGHNILRHDLPHLVANRARLAALGDAPVDTLWLNPLAFPRNPYHHLVKHYQDGRLQVGHVNDPEQDARLALQVLSDQIGRMPEARMLLMAGLMLADKTAAVEDRIRVVQAELDQLRAAGAPEPERIEVPVVPPAVTETLAELAARAEALAAEIEERTAAKGGAA